MTFKITYSVLNADMSELHRAFDGAIEKFQSQLNSELPSWIGGREFRSGQFLEDRNPSDTRQLLARFHMTPVSELNRVMEIATKAQKGWGQTPWRERVRLLRRAADLISEKRLEISVAMALETGKNRFEALGDVEESADLFRYYCDQLESAEGFDRPLASLSPNEKTRSVLKPFGVFAVISPFNFPLALAAGMSAGALLGGNSVVLKPSQETPWCGHYLYRVLTEAGLPEGVFQLVHGKGAELGKALLEHPLTNGIVFTGSKEVGMQLLRNFSKNFPKPCFLELGGKNPCYVCESANLEKAVEGVARSAFGLSGQKCSALSRVYVHEKLAQEFGERLVARAEKITIGNPLLKDTYMGPVINENAYRRYQKASEEAKRDGQVLVGARDLKAEGGDYAHGWFVAPTVVQIPDGHRLSRDELFLPFLTMHTFRHFGDAIAQGNSSEYGLTAGVFTENAAELQQYLDTAESGVLYANRMTGATTGAWPGVNSFCGWKGSGSTGKGGCGPYYVMQFMREQSQTIML